MRQHSVFLALLVLFLQVICIRPADAGLALPNALSKGDQLILYYDTRPNSDTFFIVRNEGTTSLTVQIALYGSTFALAASTNVTIPAGGNQIELASSLKPGNQVGLILVHAINSQGKPIVSRVLSGSLMAVNKGSRSGWGAQALARNAYSGFSLPTPGTVIDGTSVVLSNIQPSTLNLAAHFDPVGLNPKELIFFTFNDVSSGVTSASVAWTLYAANSAGITTSQKAFTTSGVTTFTLDGLAGTSANGDEGSMLFTGNVFGAQNRLIFFAEALGTYNVGYWLPATETGFKAEVASIFARSCARVGCHAANSLAGDLNLDPASAYGQLCGVGARCIAQPSFSGGSAEPYIAPYDPARSYLLKRVRGTAGSRMPLGCGSPSQPCLTAGEIAAISRWVLEGAKNN